MPIPPSQKLPTGSQNMGLLGRLPDEVHLQIIDKCDMKTMYSLGRTCKYWDLKRSECMAMRVNALYNRFRVSPGFFPDLLSLTGAVVSGSAVLSLFFPGAFSPKDLDIYVHKSYHDALVHYLVYEVGYEVEDPGQGGDEREDRTEYDRWKEVNLELQLVTILRHRDHPNPEVNILAVKGPSPFTAISQFHSTLVMNALSSKGIICMYPRLTFEKLGIINSYGKPLHLKERFIASIEKYIRRGFTLYYDKAQIITSCTELPRTLEEHSSYIIPLPSKEHDGRFRTFEVLSQEDWCSQWSLQPDDRSYVVF